MKYRGARDQARLRRIWLMSCAGMRLALTRDPTCCSSCCPERLAAMSRALEICHSVGVRWISSPLRRMRLSARSIAKSLVSITATSSVGVGRSAAHSREDVHTERFGDVVVGAGVERRNLHRLRVAPTTRIGTFDQPRNECNGHSVTSGSPRSRITRSGCSRPPHPFAPAARSTHRVVVGFEKDSQRATMRLRLRSPGLCS